MGLGGSFFLEGWGGGVGGRREEVYGQYEHTASVSPFSRRNRDPVPSTWAIFLSSHDRSNAKKIIKGLLGLAAKEPLQRSD